MRVMERALSISLNFAACLAGGNAATFFLAAVFITDIKSAAVPLAFLVFALVFTTLVAVRRRLTE
jgi:hypothetical protein